MTNKQLANQLRSIGNSLFDMTYDPNNKLLLDEASDRLEKQEWISVAEMLPKENGKYLVCTTKGNVYQTKFYSYPENTGGHWGQKDRGRSITHWMHLPEPPKMKGGAE